jgi:hypothetical protein
MSIGMYIEQFCSPFCTAVVPDSEVLVHQMVAKGLNSSDMPPYSLYNHVWSRNSRT